MPVCVWMRPGIVRDVHCQPLKWPNKDLKNTLTVNHCIVPEYEKAIRTHDTNMLLLIDQKYIPATGSKRHFLNSTGESEFDDDTFLDTDRDMADLQILSCSHCHSQFNCQIYLTHAGTTLSGIYSQKVSENKS